MGITINRVWSRRPLNKPWEGVATPGASGPPDTVFISIRGETTDKSLPNTNDYFSPSSKSLAASKILDYYGKVDDPNASLVDNPSWRSLSYSFAGGPSERVALMYSVDLSAVRDAPCKTTFLVGGLSGPASDHGQYYPVATFTKKINALSGMFTRFQNQYRFFSGRVSPLISFSRSYNRLRLAHERVIEFIEFNGLEYRSSEDDIININFNTEYKIDNIIVTQNGIEKHLVKGVIYYFEDTDRLNNSRTNKLLYNLNALYSLRNQKSTWTDFVSTYMPDVTVNYFGVAMTPTIAETIKQEEEAANKLFMSSKLVVETQEKLADAEVQRKSISEAMSEAQVNMQTKLSKVAEKFQEADKKALQVRLFINKYGINHLIEAAMECLAISTGVPVDALPIAMPGVAFSPWERPKPPISITIPKMYPLKLPKVDVAADVTKAIKEGLKDAGEQAIIGVMQAIAEIIVELCTKQDQELIGAGPDIPAIINDYPNPKEVLGTGADDRPPLQKYKLCLSDYALDELETNQFMLKLAQNLSPQQTCDLINGAPSSEVMERIYNIINEDSYLVTLKAAFLGTSAAGVPFPLHNEIIDFFSCIGALVSPTFCAAVYEPPINSFPDNIDLCDLEEMVVDRLDNEAFNNLLDAYNNLDSIQDDLAANPLNMDPGCGIVPALTEMPALNLTINRLFDTLIEPPKKAFIEDITGLKTILLVPQPGASADDAALLEALGSESDPGAFPGPPPPQPAHGPAKDFLGNMFGPAAGVVANLPGADIAQQTITNAIAEQNSAMQTLADGIKYDVNPVFKEQMALIDSRIETNYQKGSWYADTQDINEQAFLHLPVGDKVLYYGPRSAATQQNPYGNAVVKQSTVESTAPSSMTSGVAIKSRAQGELGVDSATTQFTNAIFNWFTNTYGVPTEDAPTVQETIDGTSKNSLWFPANLSLLNSLAYNIRKSKFFREEEFRKLILVPRRCDDIDGSYGDLSGFNDIMRQAKQDFDDNASQCPDKRVCTLGPVKDSIIFGLTSAYIQILVLEQILKNIWLLDTYGLGSFGDDVTSIIINNINRDLAGTGEISQWLLQRDTLYAGTTFHVNKLRQRSVLAGDGGKIPNPVTPPPPAAPLPLYDIPSNIASDMENHRDAQYDRLLKGSANNSSRAEDVGKWCMEYMIRLRLDEMRPSIDEVFGTPGVEMTAEQRFLRYGLPQLDVIDDKLRLENLIFTNTTFSNPSGKQNHTVPVIRIHETSLLPWNPQPPGGSPRNWSYEYVGFSTDEAEAASVNGALAIERYATFDFNFDYYHRLKTSANSGVTVDDSILTQIEPTIHELIGQPGGQEVGNNDQAPLYNGVNGPGKAGIDRASDIATSTLTVSLDKLNQLFSLVGTAGATALELAAGVGTVDTAQQLSSTNSALNDLDISNIEVLYGYEWRLHQDVIEHEGGGLSWWETGPTGQLQKALMKGSLNEQNYEAVRYWIQVMQNTGVQNPDTWETSPYSFFSDWGQLEKRHLTNPAGDDYPDAAGNYGSSVDDWVVTMNTAPDTTNRYRLVYPDGIGQTPAGATYEGFNARIGVYWYPNQNTNYQAPIPVFIPYSTQDMYPLSLFGTNTLLPDLYTYQEAEDSGPMAGSSNLYFYPHQNEGDPEWSIALDPPESGGRIGGLAGAAFNSAMYNEVRGALEDPTDTRDPSNLTVDEEQSSTGPLQGGGVAPEVMAARAGKGYNWRTNRAGWTNPQNRVPRTKDYDPYYKPSDGQVQSLWLVVDGQILSQAEAKALFDGMGALSELQDAIATLEALRDQLNVALSATPVSSQLLTTLITNVKVGARVAYYSPVMKNDAGTADGDFLGAIAAVQDNLVYNKSYPDSPKVPVLGPFYNTRSGWMAQTDAADGGYVFNTKTAISHEVTVLSDLTVTSKAAAKRMLFPQAPVPTSADQATRNAISAAYTTFIANKSFTTNLMTDFFVANKETIYAEMISPSVQWGASATATSPYDILFKQAIGAQDLMGILFLYGFSLSEGQTAGKGPEHDFKTLFTDTRASLRTILRSALADEGPYTDPESRSASDVARDTALGLALAGGGPFVEFGASFILKMLVETPIRILKGLAEMVDPHVVVGKIIRDATGQVIKQVEPYWPNVQPPIPCPPFGLPDNPEARQALTEAFGSGGALEGVTQETFAKFLDFYISGKFAESFGADPNAREILSLFIPSVSDKGINIVGTLPYSFMVPPTPLGIAYILFGLLDKDVISLTAPADQPTCPGGQGESQFQAGTEILNCEKPYESEPSTPADGTALDDDGGDPECKPETGPITTCE